MYYAEGTIDGTSKVEDNAKVYGSLLNYSTARDRAWISVESTVKDHSIVADNSKVLDGGVVKRYSSLRGGAEISRKAIVSASTLRGHTYVYGEGTLIESATLDRVIAKDGAKIRNVYLENCVVGREGDVFRAKHVVTINNLFNDTVTLYRTATGGRIQAGCQNFDVMATREELKELAAEHGWDLPPGWASLRKIFMKTVEGWH